MKGGKSEIQKKESILYFRLQKNKTKKNKKKRRSTATNKTCEQNTDHSLSAQHGLSDLRLPIPSALEAVHVRLVVPHGLVDLFLRCDDEGTILDHLVVVRLTGDDDWNRTLALPPKCACR